jgi:SAM-dependent methyltransferase
VTHTVEIWNSAYDNESAPWLIGEPQPAIVALVERSAVGGVVLDVGCGAGEHTIHLARLGYDVIGVDLSPSAVAYARANARQHGVAARFEVADATRLDEMGLGGMGLDGTGLFDTIVDSALFHVFAARGGDPTDYVRSLRAVCKPGGVVHVLALSDAEPGFGPRIPASAIRDGFADGWAIERLEPSRYRARIPADADIVTGGARRGDIVDAAAWLAQLRRL